MRTRLTDTLAIELPLLLAPMGNVSGGALAAAVSGAGGLGLVGAGYGDAAWLRRELEVCRGARVGVGFITWALAREPSVLDLALEYEPAAIMFSFGDFSPYVSRVRAAGAQIICQVQSVADAVRAAEDGADIIVAQGAEAGGHGAARGAFALIPAVADAVAPLPVVAAGGVADGRGLAAALMLGASGALIGTRFYATPEALGHDTAKAAMVAGGGDETRRTRVFDIVRGYRWPEPYTGRALANTFFTRWHGREAELLAALDLEQARYRDAAATGDIDTAVVFCGEAIDLIDSLEPAAEVVQRMAADAQQLLTRGAVLDDRQ